MKRFWVIWVTLGLMTVFSSSAMAVDLKFSGEYFAAGLYLDETALNRNVWTDSKKVAHNPGSSTAFYFQRLRVRTDFVVTPGLTLVTRFDAMERAWGAARYPTTFARYAAGTTTPAIGVTNAPLDTGSAGTRAENENIAIDWVYVNYKSPVGTFDVGYMNDGSTGTIFGNSAAPAARIKYSKSFGPATLNLAYTKVNDGERSTLNGVSGYTDADNDKYGVEGVYTWKGGRAGLQVNYYNYAKTRPLATPADAGSFKSTYWLFTPYAMAKIGPVSLQTEVNYLYGDKKYEDGVTVTGTSIDRVHLRGLSAWIDATADFKMFYVGGSVAYVSGDDPGTRDKNEGQTVTGGLDWNPCLIMFNSDRAYWVGNLAGYNGTTANGNAFINGYLAQLRGGVRPVADLDIMASFTWARADKTGAGIWVGRDYGYEIDLTATYKITNNLSYMLGAGYWIVGEYYQGETKLMQDLENNFMVINKLTLTF